MREVMRARERVKRVRELDAPLVSLLCRMVTLLSYYEKFLMILQRYGLTTVSEWPAECERAAVMCESTWAPEIFRKRLAWARFRV